jgi:ArsR family transcriptional regulator
MVASSRPIDPASRSHLPCLHDCGLVNYRTQGRLSFYAPIRPELIDVLKAAEALLAATGSAVAQCPVYGTDAAQ